MSERKQQPAVMARKIAVLEGRLAAEKEACAKAWDGYRAALYELVDVKLRLEAVEKALRGEV